MKARTKDEVRRKTPIKGGCGGAEKENEKS